MPPPNLQVVVPSSESSIGHAHPPSRRRAPENTRVTRSVFPDAAADVTSRGGGVNERCAHVCGLTRRRLMPISGLT